MMLNYAFLCHSPLTFGQKLGIIQLVSIRSLAPGMDMIAEVLTTLLQKH